VHRLVAGDQVNDGQAAVTKAKTWLEVKAFPVWTAMTDRVRHLSDHLLVGRPLSAKIKPTGYSAH
jgi:hypothetical protein